MNFIEIFKLFGSIFVDSDEANKSISKTEKSTEGLASKMGRGIKTAGKWALGITTAAVGITTAAFAMTKKVTAGFDDIAKNARKMGVSTDYYQEMEYWASQNGLSHENMEKSMKRLNQRLGQAVNGNKKYSDALTRLGVDLKEVEKGNVSTEEAMTKSIQALSEMENSQEKAALAAELFGVKLAQELMPAIDSGALSIEDAQKKAKELGIVIGEDTLNAAETFNDTWDDITRSLGAFGQKILASLMPTFQAMMDWVLEHMPQIQAVFETVFEVITFLFGLLGDAIAGVLEWLTGWKESNDEILEGIQESFVEKLTRIWEFFQEIFEKIKEFVSIVMGEVSSYLQEKLKHIKDFWIENGETILEAVNNLFNGIKKVIEFVMPIVTSIIKTAWKVIQQVFDSAIGIILGLIQVFSGLLTGDFEKIKEGLVRIWESLWDLIKGVVSGAWNLLSSAFSALWDNISGWFTGLKDAAFDWGKNMISGFIDGIKNMGKKVGEAASNIVKKAGDFLKFWSPAKKGEGRFITKWGENMVDGFLDGVRNEADEAGKVMNGLIEGMSPKSLDFNVSGRGVFSRSRADIGAQESKGSEVVSFADMFRGANFYVQKEDDIETLAKRLGDYIQKSARSKGVVMF